MNKKILTSLALCLILVFSAVATACDNGGVTPGEIPLGAFEILSPAKNATDADVNPRISWTEEDNAEKYIVSVSKTSDFAQIFAEEITARTYTAISETLEYDTEYHVRIYAVKTVSGKDTALSYRTTAFKTKADHDTPINDYSVTRTVHDFEDFADTAELTELFKWHTGGDELKPTLAAGEGADGSTAMKLAYKPGTYGWSYVTSLNPLNKRVWSGATGIRFWVNGNGSGATLTVRIGKRGYQQWSASLKLTSMEPKYVSIPFSVFDDLGGGDGIWELTGMVRLDFGCRGGLASNILIDNVTIGSDALHSQDTRSEAASKASIRMFDDFEGTTQAEAVGKWSLGNAVASATLETATSNTKMVVTTTGGTQIAIRDGVLAKYDFSDINGFRMKLQVTASTVTVRFRVGTSSSSYYEIRKKVDSNSNATEMVCDFVANEATVALPDKANFNYMEIYVDAACTLKMDDMEFYTGNIGAQDTVWEFDAGEYATDAALQAEWDNSTLVTLGGSAGAETVLFTAADSSAANMQYQFGAAAVVFQNVYAIRLKYTATNVTSLKVKLQNGALTGGNPQEVSLDAACTDGTHESIVYFRKMTGAFTIFNAKFLILTIQGATGATVEFTNIEFLLG